MRPLPHTTRSNSSGETSWDAGNFGATDEDREYLKELIATANAIPITLIFQAYKIRVDQYNRKAICPFPEHKGGHESTASFNYYPETNSFWCFGCKTGRSVSNFVAQMEGLPLSKAATRALEIANGKIDLSTLEKLQSANYQEKLTIIMDFSVAIRNSIRSGLDNEKIFNCLEEITATFDQMNEKYDLDQTALKSLVAKLKEKIAQCQ